MRDICQPPDSRHDCGLGILFERAFVEEAISGANLTQGKIAVGQETT